MYVFWGNLQFSSRMNFCHTFCSIQWRFDSLQYFFCVCMRPTWALFLYYFIYMRQLLIPYHFCIRCTQAYSTCMCGDIVQTHIEKTFSLFSARAKERKANEEPNTPQLCYAALWVLVYVCVQCAQGMRKWSLWSWWAIDSRYSLHSTSVSWNTLNEVDSFLFNCVFVCLFVCWFWFWLILHSTSGCVIGSWAAGKRVCSKYRRNKKQTNSNDRRVSVLSVSVQV